MTDKACENTSDGTTQDCREISDCCDCGGSNCGCRGCFSCNACDACLEE